MCVCVKLCICDEFKRKLSSRHYRVSNTIPIPPITKLCSLPKSSLSKNIRECIYMLVQFKTQKNTMKIFHASMSSHSLLAPSLEKKSDTRPICPQTRR